MKSCILNIIVTLLILNCCNPLRAQDYFQQQTDYIIKARLDTSTQTLTANSLLKYKNNSEDTLNSLIIQKFNMRVFADLALLFYGY